MRFEAALSQESFLPKLNLLNKDNAPGHKFWKVQFPLNLTVLLVVFLGEMRD